MRTITYKDYKQATRMRYTKLLSWWDHKIYKQVVRAYNLGNKTLPDEIYDEFLRLSRGNQCEH